MTRSPTGSRLPCKAEEETPRCTAALSSPTASSSSCAAWPSAPTSPRQCNGCGVAFRVCGERVEVPAILRRCQHSLLATLIGSRTAVPIRRNPEGEIPVTSASSAAAFHLLAQFVTSDAEARMVLEHFGDAVITGGRVDDDGHAQAALSALRLDAEYFLGSTTNDVDFGDFTQSLQQFAVQRGVSPGALLCPSGMTWSMHPGFRPNVSKLNQQPAFGAVKGAAKPLPAMPPSPLSPPPLLPPPQPRCAQQHLSQACTVVHLPPQRAEALRQPASVAAAGQELGRSLAAARAELESSESPAAMSPPAASPVTGRRTVVAAAPTPELTHDQASPESSPASVRTPQPTIRRLSFETMQPSSAAGGRPRFEILSSSTSSISDRGGAALVGVASSWSAAAVGGVVLQPPAWLE